VGPRASLDAAKKILRPTRTQTLTLQSSSLQPVAIPTTLFWLPLLLLLLLLTLQFLLENVWKACTSGSVIRNICNGIQFFTSFHPTTSIWKKDLIYVFKQSGRLLKLPGWFHSIVLVFNLS
jgi:hypothetical protein